MRGAARGGRAKALSGLPGPAGRGRRSHFEFRYRQSWAADAGARLHLDFLCDSGAGHEGCSEETARHIWVTGGSLAFPSLSPATSAQKICRGRRFAVRWRGNHLRIGTRVLILLCRHGCVPPHRAGAAFPKGAWPAQKGCPLQDLGAFPRLILSLPVARTRLLSSVPRQVAQNPMHSPKCKARPQPGGRKSSNVSQSSLKTALNTKHIVYRSLSRETLLARSVE